MSAVKLTKAQRRYLEGVRDGKNMLRPRGIGGEFGDLDVLGRLVERGLITDPNAPGDMQLTDVGRAALKGAK
jgi:hypothetical protein